MLVRGKLRELMRLRDSARLQLNAEFKLRDETLQTEDLRLVQALVAPGSNLVGQTLKELDFRNRYEALVLAIQRRGEPIQEKLNSVRFRLGDALLGGGPTRGALHRPRPGRPARNGRRHR